MVCKCCKETNRGSKNFMVFLMVQQPTDAVRILPVAQMARPNVTDRGKERSNGTYVVCVCEIYYSQWRCMSSALTTESCRMCVPTNTQQVGSFWYIHGEQGWWNGTWSFASMDFTISRSSSPKLKMEKLWIISLKDTLTLTTFLVHTNRSNNTWR